MSLSRTEAIEHIVERLAQLDAQRLKDVYNLLFEKDHIISVGGDRFEHQDMVD